VTRVLAEFRTQENATPLLHYKVSAVPALLANGMTSVQVAELSPPLKS
jgi:hypothetical protein